MVLAGVVRAPLTGTGRVCGYTISVSRFELSRTPLTPARFRPYLATRVGDPR